MLEYDGEDREPANTLAADIILTTSFILANKVIDHEIEVISAECVFGMNIFRDFFQIMIIKMWLIIMFMFMVCYLLI